MSEPKSLDEIIAAGIAGARRIGDIEPDPDEVEYVRRERAAAREAVFLKAVPARFKDASLDDLGENQQPDALRDWLKGKSPTLLLVGPVGTGKTHAAWALLRAALGPKVRVYGSTVLDLLDALRPNAPHSPLPRLAVGSDVFLFDDLAMERPTEWAVEQIGGVVDERTRERKRQIVTTNATSQQLAERLGERTMSRLTGGATVVSYAGDDLRRRYWA